MLRFTHAFFRLIWSEEHTCTRLLGWVDLWMWIRLSCLLTSWEYLAQFLFVYDHNAFTCGVSALRPGWICRHWCAAKIDYLIAQCEGLQSNRGDLVGFVSPFDWRSLSAICGRPSGKGQEMQEEIRGSGLISFFWLPRKRIEKPIEVAVLCIELI